MRNGDRVKYHLILSLLGSWCLCYAIDDAVWGYATVTSCLYGRNIDIFNIPFIDVRNGGIKTRRSTYTKLVAGSHCDRTAAVAGRAPFQISHRTVCFLPIIRRLICVCCGDGVCGAGAVVGVAGSDGSDAAADGDNDAAAVAVERRMQWQ